jgi:TetR/AcrR family transcriptional regulator, transcriptional repressor for nem operon
MTISSRSASTRQLLLETGLQMARETGMRKLTVRGVAARAGVNPGGFVYHFGNRDAFVTELIETWYQPLFAELQLRADLEGSPIERLRAMVLQLMDFALAHRAFVTHLLQDAAAGEQAVVRFVRTLGQRHPRLLVQAVEEAQQAGLMVSAHPVQILMFLMAPLGGPLLLVEMAGGLSVLPADGVALCAEFAHQRERIAERLDWALKGLALEGGQ